MAPYINLIMPLFLFSVVVVLIALIISIICIVLCGIKAYRKRFDHCPFSIMQQSYFIIFITKPWIIYQDTSYSLI